MRKFVSMLGALAIAALALLPVAVPAQVVTPLPIATAGSGAVKDLGNGPLELRVLQGNAQVFTSSSSGVGSTSGSSTTLTLTSTPTTANAPCVGCIVSGTGITSGTTVASYGGGLTVILSAAMTVASSTAVAWGAACPSSIGSIAAMLVQASVGADLPLYTQARVCATGQNNVGATLLSFPIGAH